MTKQKSRKPPGGPPEKRSKEPPLEPGKRARAAREAAAREDAARGTADEEAWWFELAEIVNQMMSDLDTVACVNAALLLKEAPRSPGIAAALRSGPSTWSQAAARNIAQALPSTQALADQLSAEELQQLLRDTEAPIREWLNDVKNPNTGIPDRMRRRRQHVGFRLGEGDRAPDRTKGQFNEALAKRLGTSVSTLKRLPKDPPKVVGGLMTLLLRISELRPGWDPPSQKK